MNLTKISIKVTAEDENFGEGIISGQAEQQLDSEEDMVFKFDKVNMMEFNKESWFSKEVNFLVIEISISEQAHFELKHGTFTIKENNDESLTVTIGGIKDQL